MAERFKTALTLFGECHRIYNKCYVTEAELENLSMLSRKWNGNNTVVRCSLIPLQAPVSKASWHSTAKHSPTVLPKMHMLEEHVLPFMRKWRIGCGFLGEQGAESIHKYFNLLERTYSSIPDRLTRLK